MENEAKIKALSDELDKAKQQIKQLTDQNSDLQKKVESLEAQVSDLKYAGDNKGSKL